MFFDEYYLLEYIQSSGTQYINMGFGVSNTQKFRYIGRAKLTSVQSANTSRCIFGYFSSTQRCFFGTGNSKWTMGYGGTFNALDTPLPSAGLDYDIDIEYKNGSQKIQINNSVINYSISSTFTTGDMLLMNLGGQQTTGQFDGRLYGNQQFYIDDVLIRDYVPAQRKTDNVIGLYDLANNTFYTNAGTGTFTAGHIVDVSVNPIGTGTVDVETSGNNTILTANANAGYEFENWTLDGYTQLEYIESSGTQYINTGVVGKSGLSAIIDFVYLTSGEQWLLGCKDGTNRIYFNQKDSANKQWVGYGSPITTGYTLSLNTRYISETVLETGNQKCLIDGTQVWSNSSSSSYDTGKNITMFALNNNDSMQSFTSAKLYSCKIYDSSTLVRDFIPAIRHSDAQIGLLDLVHFKFYGNSGTGQFIGGNPI